MPKKLVVTGIEKCEDCTYFYHGEWDDECNKEFKTVNRDSIPDWCHLPEDDT